MNEKVRLFIMKSNAGIQLNTLLVKGYVQLRLNWTLIMLNSKEYRCINYFESYELLSFKSTFT